MFCLTLLEQTLLQAVITILVSDKYHVKDYKTRLRKQIFHRPRRYKLNFTHHYAYGLM